MDALHTQLHVQLHTKLHIYCLKCKRQTLTNNIEQVRTKNNRNMIKGICAICGVRKNKFVK